MKGGENSGWKFIRPPRSIISSLFPRPYLRPSRFFNLPPLTHRYPSIPTFTLISPFEVSVPSILTLLRRWLSNRAIYCNVHLREHALSCSWIHENKVPFSNAKKIEDWESNRMRNDRLTILPRIQLHLETI